MIALGQIVDALRNAPELLTPVVIYLIKTFTLVQTETLQEIVLQVKPEEETEMMSIYARELIAKGEALGEARGEHKRAVSMVLRQIQRKFGSMSSQVQAQVENAELSTLEDWADRILDARTLSDLFETQEQAIMH
ncbi:MAG: DUF4351 domain-containing protein [Magnetococcales bacterium]|nr:DUF4351 domain-containing protein [Magnetococcales bacterium]